MSNPVASLRTFTAFCRQSNRQGTMFIQAVDARDASEALDRAIADCSSQWKMSPADIDCIGLAAGDIEIVYWDD